MDEVLQLPLKNNAEILLFHILKELMRINGTSGELFAGYTLDEVEELAEEISNNNH